MSRLPAGVRSLPCPTVSNDVSPKPRSHADAPAINLKTRCRLPELMDDPNLDETAHRAALTGLRRVNYFSRSCDILWPAIRRLAGADSRRPLRILDIATGGGDVVTGLSKRAMQADVSVQIDGCDISSQAIDYARGLASSTSPFKNEFFQLNVLTDSIPSDYDVVMCSLFLHHLSEADAETLIRRMSQACRISMLVNDLRRTRLGYALAWAGCRLLTRSPIVHIDGPLSVRAALTDEEVRDLATRAGLETITLSRHWPQRFLMSWNRP